VGAAPKRAPKVKNATLTTENHSKRLCSMDPAEFQELDGKWVSGFGFDGSFTAAQLADKGTCPVPGAASTYAVFAAAVKHGFAPLGIVSEQGKQVGVHPTNPSIKLYEPHTQVAGDRVYVGFKLRNLPKSKFCVSTEDIAYLAEPEAASASASAPAPASAPEDMEEGEEVDAAA
jgi:hypothetical protein